MTVKIGRQIGHCKIGKLKKRVHCMTVKIERQMGHYKIGKLKKWVHCITVKIGRKLGHYKIGKLKVHCKTVMQKLMAYCKNLLEQRKVYHMMQKAYCKTVLLLLQKTVDMQ